MMMERMISQMTIVMRAASRGVMHERINFFADFWKIWTIKWTYNNFAPSFFFHGKLPEYSPQILHFYLQNFTLIYISIFVSSLLVLLLVLL